MLDGYDVRQFARNDLRDSFGMVLQDTWLYNGTIRENIRYGRLSATDEEVLAAAKAAQVDHFVRTLPDGYDTVLNEEATNISQGQKQLLTIARTIISEPRILIFDEATSSVDTRTELAIQKAMDNLMEGRTSFIIAHRLSTIRDADLILVMKDGDIVETGTHAELLAKQGFYAELYQQPVCRRIRRGRVTGPCPVSVRPWPGRTGFFFLTAFAPGWRKAPACGIIFSRRHRRACRMKHTPRT